MRIGIDIDGVLTDIEQWQLDFGGKYFSVFGKSVANKNEYLYELYLKNLQENLQVKL